MTSPEVALIARRRRFSLEQKQQILAEAELTSMAAVSQRHGIARSLLQRWKTLGVEPTRRADPFVRLLPAREMEGPGPRPSSIFIHIDGAIVIELPPSSDPAQIANLVGSLRR